MPLYQVPEGRYQDPIKMRNKIHLAAFERKCNRLSFDKCCRIVDDALRGLTPSKASNLVFTRTGFLVGHQSVAPHADIDYLWDKMKQHLGATVALLRAMGQLIKWRISLLNDIWLCYPEETDMVDEISKMTIYVNNFWIDNAYATPKKQAATIEQLIEKFGRKKL
jgi:hypothetical protein